MNVRRERHHLNVLLNTITRVETIAAEIIHPDDMNVRFTGTLP